MLQASITATQCARGYLPHEYSLPDDHLAIWEQALSTHRMEPFIVSLYDPNNFLFRS